MNDTRLLMNALATGIVHESLADHFQVDSFAMGRIIDAIQGIKTIEEEERKENKEKMEKELQRRRQAIMKATAELYPDRQQIPVLTKVQEHLAAQGDEIPIDSIRTQASILREQGRWKWNKKEVKTINPIKSFVLAKVKGQPVRYQINEFVKAYYKEKKAEPTVDLIASVLGRGQSTVLNEVVAMRRDGKWPISLRG